MPEDRAIWPLACRLAVNLAFGLLMPLIENLAIKFRHNFFPRGPKIEIYVFINF
jgi:hypothetical protein